MLESLHCKYLHIEIFRLVAYLDDAEFLQVLGLDQAGRVEMTALLEADSTEETLEHLLNEPFERDTVTDRLSSSRYSDGSFAVFYASIEPATAEAEVRHRAPRLVGKPGEQRGTWYQILSCDFDGLAKDLRPKVQQWPGLTDESDYRFCNKLGAAARQSLDGLLVPSVRRPEGTNVPVFHRYAISRPRALELVQITCDAS